MIVSTRTTPCRTVAPGSWSGGEARAGPSFRGSAVTISESLPGGAVAPQPPHVAAERLGEEDEGDDERALGQRLGQDVRGRDRQDDPLRGSDELAPVARRQRLAHPRQRPPGGEKRVARRADREHPRAGRAGDIHAEDEDQERVDLTVELRAESRGRLVCRATRPSTEVERERERASDTSSATGAGSANESATSAATPTASEARASVTQSAGAQPDSVMAGEAVRQGRAHDHRAGESDDPTGGAEADGPGKRGQQQNLGGESGQRSG